MDKSHHEKIGEMKVSDCSLLNALTCKEDLSIEKASKKLASKKEKYIIILNKHKIPKALVTLTDIVYKTIAKGKDYKKLNVSDIAVHNLFFLEDHEPLTKAYLYMVGRNRLFCPVVSGKKFAGILTLSEVMKKLYRK